jgi:GNAT superfamily N-acetyltransferase
MPLLLLADETIEAIGRYIYQCDVYVLAGDDDLLAGVFALYRNSAAEIELKNMAVAEGFQGRGLGSFMLEEVCRIAAADGYGKVVVGTATVGRQLDFYKKNGFVPFGLRKDFFLTYYAAPIFEDGEQLRDMVLLEKYV